MRNRIAVLLGFALFSIAACHADSLTVPTAALSAIGIKPSFSRVFDGCPDGYYCETPIRNDPIYPDLDTVATNCPEACGGMESGTPGNYLEDAVGWIDRLEITCPTRGFTLWYSSHSCWDCKHGCAGTRCAPGKDCITVAGQPGFDCRELTCAEGLEGWSGTTSDGSKVPLCRRRLLAYESPYPGGPPKPIDTTITQQ